MTHSINITLLYHLLFSSLAKGLWEPDLKHEAFNDQEPEILPSASAGVLNQGVSSGWACSSPAVPIPMLATLCLQPEKRQLTGATVMLVTTPGGHQTAITMLTSVRWPKEKIFVRGIDVAPDPWLRGTGMADCLAHSSGALHGPLSHRGHRWVKPSAAVLKTILFFFKYFGGL